MAMLPFLYFFKTLLNILIIKLSKNLITLLPYCTAYRKKSQICLQKTTTAWQHSAPVYFYLSSVMILQTRRWGMFMRWKHDNKQQHRTHNLPTKQQDLFLTVCVQKVKLPAHPVLHTYNLWINIKLYLPALP